MRYLWMVAAGLFLALNVSAQETTGNLEREDFISKHVDDIKAELPARIDEGTTFFDIERQGDVILYTYRLDLDTSRYAAHRKAMLTTEMRQLMCPDLEKGVCQYMKDVLDHGFQINSLYQDENGIEIFQCVFMADMCFSKDNQAPEAKD